MIKLASCVILYNPDDKVYFNILSYLDDVDILYIYDNSETKYADLDKLKKTSKKIEYFFNGSNDGIASALNFCLEKALNDGYNYILTMDQDSIFNKELLRIYIEKIERTSLSKVALYSIVHNIKNYNIPKSNEEFSYILTTATSGNIINLDYYKIYGGFKYQLFIDYVDIEFCLRANKNNWYIVRFNNLLMEHSLGDLEVVKFLGMTFSLTHHSDLRLYYRIRNRLYVVSNYWNIYPAYSFQIFRMIFTDLIKVLFFESGKHSKLKMIFIGFLHFASNKYGEFQR